MGVRPSNASARCQSSAGRSARAGANAALRERPANTQARLAAATGRDKTRLIPILDRLEQRGLLRRGTDPADRRNRTVDLAESGRALVAQCQDGIRRMERDLLTDLPDADRDSFIGLLERVAELVARRRPGP